MGGVVGVQAPVGAEVVGGAVQGELLGIGAVDGHVADGVRRPAPHRHPEEGCEGRKGEHVEGELVVDLDGLEDVGAGRTGGGDEAEQAEQPVDGKRGGSHRDEHERGQANRERPSVVLAVDGDDREHDQVGEDERQHAGEADAARPEHGRKRHVSDRADEAQHGDQRADDDVLDRAERFGRVAQEERVERRVSEQADEPGQEEPGGDLAVEHLPVAAEVMRDIGPGRHRGQPVAPAQLRACRLVLVAGVGLLSMPARLLLEPGRDEHAHEERHQDDHHQPAEVLGQGELPADQHPEHEAELPHQVGGRELKRHRRRRGRALLEQALCDRDGRVRARRGRRAEPGRPRQRSRPDPGQLGLDPLPRHPRLHDRRDQESQHQRPPHLPRHQERVLDRDPHLRDHVAHRRAPSSPTAASSSASPRSVSRYMVILPCFRALTSSCRRSCCMWWDTSVWERSLIQAKSHTHSSWPPRSDRASESRVGSATAP